MKKERRGRLEDQSVWVCEWGSSENVLALYIVILFCSSCLVVSGLNRVASIAVTTRKDPPLCIRRPNGILFRNNLCNNLFLIKLDMVLGMASRIKYLYILLCALCRSRENSNAIFSDETASLVKSAWFLQGC